MKDHYKIIIIGGGASGLAAALSSCEYLDRRDRGCIPIPQSCGDISVPRGPGDIPVPQGCGDIPVPQGCEDSPGLNREPEILILEKNDQPGSKIPATGNGRCNLGNDYMDPSCYRSEDPDRAWKILTAYGRDWTDGFFRDIGLFTRSIGGYIYPYNEQASAVRNLLESVVEENSRLRLVTGTEVVSVQRPVPGKVNSSYRVKSSKGDYYGEKIIVTTGGYAGPSFGCSGDGYRIAKDLGHSLVPPLPALTALISKAPFLKRLSGVRCQACITLFIDGEKTASDQGQIQWTDYGVSGVVVFQVSRHAVKALSAPGKEKKQVLLTVDFMPGKTEEELRKLIQSLGRIRSGRRDSRPLAKVLESLFHSKLIPVILREAGIEGGQETIDTLTEKKWAQLIGAIKRFPLRISGYKSYDKAQVTQGGVPFNELDENLQSLKSPGLYFAGEIVDVDGICGGYNLQWAWSSGAAAGRGAAASI